MKKYRVWSGTMMLRGHGQVRAIIAGTQKDAARETNQSVGAISKYWSITGNKVEIEVATSRPGVLFWRHDQNYNFKVEDYQAIERRKLK